MKGLKYFAAAQHNAYHCAVQHIFLIFLFTHIFNDLQILACDNHGPWRLWV